MEIKIKELTLENFKPYGSFSRLINPTTRGNGLPGMSFHADMEVLELACGTGQLSFDLAKYVRRYEATDFSEAMIEQAKKEQLKSKAAAMRKQPVPESLVFSVK